MFSQDRKNIKVLYPVLHYPPVIGGLEQWEQNIAERQGDDAEVIVVTGRVKGVLDFEEKGGVKIFRTSLFALNDLSHSSWFYILTATPFVFVRSLMLVLFSRKIDIIHCQGFISAVLGYLLSFASRKPFLGTEQSLGWGSGKSRWLRGVVYRQARFCIASSSAVAEEFKKVGIPQKKIVVIPNGVDLSAFFPWEKCERCAGLTPASPAGRPRIRILSAGRLEKVKGHKYLLDAFGAVVNTAEFDPQLILVGDGSERANLEKQCKDLGIRNLVEFAGEVPHSELSHYYHKADVFIMPSLSEGFGIAALEAMACGVPVVASRTGGLVDIISEDAGILVAAGDVSSIAEAIIKILKNPGAYTSARAQEFSWDSIARRVGQLYAEKIQ